MALNYVCFVINKSLSILILLVFTVYLLILILLVFTKSHNGTSSQSFRNWTHLKGDFSSHSWATEATLLKNPSLNMAVYLVDTDMDEIELENFFGSIREDEPGILDQAFCPDS